MLEQARRSNNVNSESINNILFENSIDLTNDDEEEDWLNAFDPNIDISELKTPINTKNKYKTSIFSSESESKTKNNKALVEKSVCYFFFLILFFLISFFFKFLNF